MVDSKSKVTKGSTRFCMNLHKLQIMRDLYTVRFHIIIQTFMKRHSYFNQGSNQNFCQLSLLGEKLFQTWRPEITDVVCGSTHTVV
jgi:hypothetical protein